MAVLRLFAQAREAAGTGSVECPTTSVPEVLDWARKDIRTAAPLAHVVKTVRLAKRLITDEEAAREAKELDALNAESFKTDGTARERLIYNSTLVSRRNRCADTLRRHAAQKTEPTFPMEMHAIRLGDIAFATNCFETRIST